MRKQPKFNIHLSQNSEKIENLSQIHFKKISFIAKYFQIYHKNVSKKYFLETKSKFDTKNLL